MAISKANPPTLKYRFLSAMTNPTVKNIFEAGINGKVRSVRARKTATELVALLSQFENNFNVLLCFGLNTSMNALRERMVIKDQKLIAISNL